MERERESVYAADATHPSLVRPLLGTAPRHQRAVPALRRLLPRRRRVLQRARHRLGGHRCSCAHHGPELSRALSQCRVEVLQHHAAHRARVLGRGGEALAGLHQRVVRGVVGRGAGQQGCAGEKQFPARPRAALHLETAAGEGGTAAPVQRSVAHAGCLRHAVARRCLGRTGHTRALEPAPRAGSAGAGPATGRRGRASALHRPWLHAGVAAGRSDRDPFGGLLGLVELLRRGFMLRRSAADLGEQGVNVHRGP